MGMPLLLVEDTPSLSLVYKTVLNKADHQVECAYTLQEAQAKYAATHYDIVLLDLVLPDGDGQDLMLEIQRSHPDCKIIVITANGSVNRAVQAMRAGAFDFLVKPFDENRLLSAVRNAKKAHAAADQTRTTAHDDEFHGFIGASPVMRDIYKMVDNIGRSTATVFITGDSGTGKEVCAQAIHTVSNRSEGPFIPLNCGAIPRDLLESEVFGHLKGSFTGAIANKKGAAEAAHGGTLFLDEICEMDLALQTKLLRFLQTSTIQPVGATTPKHVDVRIVCATNRDPREEVRAGRFREDLFYRLHVVPIHLPPLAGRGDDVNLIADKMLSVYSAEEGKTFMGLSDTVRQVFRAYDWPGNVRQLLNALRNVVVLNDAELVEQSMLPPEILRSQLPDTPQPVRQNEHSLSAPPTALPIQNSIINGFVGSRLADVERSLIEATIEHCGGSVPKAAHMLDVSASTIYRKREAWANEDRSQG